MESLALAAMVGSQGFSLISSVQAGRQQAAVYKAQAKQSELQARNTMLQGRQQSLAIKEQLDRDTATQAAGFAARGILAGEGSAAAAIDQSNKMATRDIQYAMYGANMGYYQNMSQAGQYRVSGSAAKLSGYVNAANTLTKNNGLSLLE